MSALRDLYSGLNVVQMSAPVIRTADVNSASIDTRGYDSLMLVGLVGISGDTLSGSVMVELEVEESDDDSTWTDVADADLMNYVSGTNTGTFAVIDDPAEDDARYITGYRGSKRYVRVVGNLTGTHTNGIELAVLGIQGHAHQMPVNANTIT